MKTKGTREQFARQTSLGLRPQTPCPTSDIWTTAPPSRGHSKKWKIFVYNLVLINYLLFDVKLDYMISRCSKKFEREVQKKSKFSD